MGYTPLRDYGIIGDMRTAALVSREGAIDWCCLPRFDSASVFARILDDGKGGYWSIAPAGPFESNQRYERGTNILVTRFRTKTGVMQLTDFMPVMEWDRQLASHHEIHRRIEVVEGSVEIEVRFEPRFDYAQSPPSFRSRRHGVLASDRRNEVLVIAGHPGEHWTIDAEERRAVTRFSLEAGEERPLVLRYDEDEVWPLERYRSGEVLEDTRQFWTDWSEDIEYQGEYRPLVERSALTLKLLFYAPSGAVVAAPTTSLPERLGGNRNWDYRYSWLRDSTYTLFGLYALGKFEEMERYMVYLKKVCRRHGEFLQVLFGVEGETELTERELDHLEGYCGSRPVRVGNAASEQFQLDIYGEVMDSIHIWRKKNEMTEGMWALCCRLADEVCRKWHEPDHGVWEVRGPRRHFVFSKVMGWVTVDRAIRAAEELGLEGNVEEWRETRTAIREEVLEKGWSEERQAFVQHYETDAMDAANLLLPILRFLPADDPRVLSTADRIVEELSHSPSGLLRRYRGGDGIDGGEGAFWVNTFHLAQLLALSGDNERAVEIFENAIRPGSPLGLFSEEVDTDTGEMVGNFPQAFTHIGLINAAHVIARTRQTAEPQREMMLSD